MVGARGGGARRVFVNPCWDAFKPQKVQEGGSTPSPPFRSYQEVEGRGSITFRLSGFLGLFFGIRFSPLQFFPRQNNINMSATLIGNHLENGRLGIRVTIHSKLIII